MIITVQTCRANCDCKLNDYAEPLLPYKFLTYA